MFRQIGLIALLSIEKKKEQGLNEKQLRYRLWREKVIEYAMNRLKPFEFRLFMASIGEDDAEGRRALNRMGEQMKRERIEAARRIIDELVAKSGRPS